MSLDGAISDLLRAHAAIGRAVRAFTAKIGPIIYNQQNGMPRFEVTRRDAVTIVVLMAARIASGLNAARALLEKGYAWEIAVLLRTVEDFRLTISFLEDGLGSPSPNSEYVRFVSSYFSQQVLSGEDWMRQSAERWYLSAKKKRAADVRLMAKFGNQERLRRILEVEEEMLSGYVHGLYRQNMEMYRGSTNRGDEGFVVDGAPNARPAGTMARQIAIYTHRCLIDLIAVAERLGLTEQAEILYQEWKRFDQSAVYS